VSAHTEIVGRLDRILELVEPSAPLFPNLEGPPLLLPGTRWIYSLDGLTPGSYGLSLEVCALSSNRLRMEITIAGYRSRPIEVFIGPEAPPGG
jgi:hypothetical protein